MSRFSSVNRQLVIPIAIICWSLLGFAFQIDLSQQWGCVIFSEQHLDVPRLFILVFIISMFLLSLLIRKESSRFRLLVIELGVFLIILLFVKGGYATGYLGDPDTGIQLFDSIALFLRFWNISGYLKAEIPVHDKRKRLKATVVVTVLIMVIKINYLTLPVVSL